MNCSVGQHIVVLDKLREIITASRHTQIQIKHESNKRMERTKNNLIALSQNQGYTAGYIDANVITASRVPLGKGEKL